MKILSILMVLRRRIARKKHYIAFDEHEKSKCIFTKVSRNRVQRHFAMDKNRKLLQRFTPTMIGEKPKVIRGGKCDSFNSGYAIIGERSNRLTGMNGKYDFKSNIPDTTKTMLENKTKHIIDQLHHSMTLVTSFVHRKLSIM